MNEKNYFKTLVILLLSDVARSLNKNGVPTNDEIFQQLNIGKTTKSKVKKFFGETLMIDN